MTPMRIRHLGSAVLLPALAIGAVALLSPAVAQEAAETIEMTEEMRFMPEEVTISVGDTVEWRNVSAMPHTVTADPDLADDPANVELPEGAEPFDSGEIAPDETWTYTFEQAGTYRYFCQPHEGQGMVATITVN